MNKIEQLIEELCPQGVEFRALGEVAKFLKGKSLPKKNIVPDGVNKCIHYGELFTQYPAIIKEVISKTYQVFDDSVLSISNDVLMPTSDVTPNGLAVASCLQEDGIILGGDILIIRGEVIDGHFLSLFIRNNKIKILQLVRGSTVYHIYAKDLAKFQIPIPPLAIQKEIVKILDNFTRLEAELEAELEARKKQYEHYREELLTFGDDVEWKPLGEVGYVAMCKRIFKNQTSSSGEIPFFTIGTFGKEPKSFISEKIYDEYKTKYSFPKKGDVLISASGTIGRLVIYDGEPAYFQDSNIIWLKNDESEVLNKFLYYFYTITKWETEGGTIKRLYNRNFNKIQIPIPPLSKQKEIVAILDKFDALVNDISTGLPAEIEARRKQYEYYRNQLLTFKPLELQDAN